MSKISLSNRQVSHALNHQGRVVLPWPREYLGVYGSNEFDGSPTFPEGEDAALQRWASEIPMPDGCDLVGAIPGRKPDGTPVVIITIRPRAWPYGSGY